MAEGSTWGISNLVKWILIIAIIILSIWSVYTYLLTPVVSLFNGDIPGIESIFLISKGFKIRE